jgi:hypothetical protein
MIVISITILSIIAVYAIILIMTSGAPLFSRPNLANVLSIVAWILISLVAFLRIKFHGDDLYNLPVEGKVEMKHVEEHDMLS